MSATRLIWWRDTRALFVSASGFGLLAGFLALSGWTFVELLRRNEGGFALPAAIWGLALAPWLPALCVAATMRLFAGERQSGTLETLLTAPVSARAIVLGKFGAALTLALAGEILAAASLAALVRLTPEMAGELAPAGVLAAALMLALQAAAWTAAGTLASLLARRPAGAAVLSALFIAAPYAVYQGLDAWTQQARARVWDWPPLTHVTDFATGLFALDPLVLYVSATWCVLFVSVRLLEARDLRTR